MTSDTKIMTFDSTDIWNLLTYREGTGLYQKSLSRVTDIIDGAPGVINKPIGLYSEDVSAILTYREDTTHYRIASTRIRSMLEGNIPPIPQYTNLHG